ncbi:MAG TPA: hypothetical protein VGC42_13615 [Kofleriaceae bacterium]
MMVLALAATAACEHKSADSSSGLGFPTRAAAVGDLPDNPMIANIPADTAYALVSFKPFPLELIQKFMGVSVPMWRKLLENEKSSDPADEVIRQDVVGALDHLDVATIEAQGFTTKARVALYGLPYPVLRLEIADGEKIFGLIQRTAERWHKPLPPVTQRAGGRFWQIDSAEISFVLAILPKELVVAVAPKAVIDNQLAQILGEQKPAQALSAAQFKSIAERDGYTGLGIGFADLARIAALVAKQAPTPACSEAITGLARRVPRVTTGYGELSGNKMSFGMVVELAPDVLAEAKTLTGKLAGLDQLLAAKPAPAMAMAFAVDPEHARLAGGHAAAVLADLGQRCQFGGMSDAMQNAVTALAKPLPPFVGGLHGGYAVVSKIVVGQHGPENVEGFGSVQIDNAGEVVKLAQMKLTTFDLPTDGKPHVLPAELAPIKGHAAANDHAIGFASGPTSEADATRGLGGKLQPAPLAIGVFDYSQLGSLMPALPPGADPTQVGLIGDMKKMFSMLGVLVMQLVIDDRGVVMWMSLDSK